MYKRFAICLAATLCMLAGCASTGAGGSGSEAGGATSSGSGITMFGTIDANVSGARNR